MKLSRTLRRADPLRGVITDASKRWILVHELDRDLFFRGHAAVRANTVKSLHPYRPAFAQQALELMGQQALRPEGIDLASAQTLIASAAAHWLILHLEREALYPKEGLFGMPLKVGTRRLKLRWIDTSAVWDEEPVAYDIADITKVCFGDHYLRMLATVSAHIGNQS